METNKNTLLRTASILMAVCALAAIIISAVNTFSTINSFGNMSADEISMIESELSEVGMSAEQAVGLVSGIGYVGLAFIVIFNLVKIIIGILGFQRAETSSTLFIAWGIVFLIFGVLNLGSIFSLLGICNLLGGIVAPVLFLIGGSRNKKQTRSA